MPFQTGGELHLDFPEHEKYTGYRRDLDLANAIATTSYTVDGVQFKREVFAAFSTKATAVPSPPTGAAS